MNIRSVDPNEEFAGYTEGGIGDHNAWNLGAALGGAVGSRVDRGQKPSHYTEAISQEVIILAKKFFELLAKIFNALKYDFASNSTE